MYFYNSMNPANLSGAIDVIVIEQPDGSLLSTPFHVRFGKIAVFNRDEKYVDIQINGEEIDLKMKLNEAGIGHFVREVDEEEEVPDYLATSPMPEISTADKNDTKPDAKRQRAETRMRAEQKRLTSDSSSLSRSPSPRNYKKSTAQDAHLPKVEEITMEERQIEAKKKLPFSSSIFSIRKNRSLPNLKFGVNSEIEEKEQETKKEIKHKRKNTMGGIDVRKLLECAPHQLIHARTMPKVASKRSISPPTLLKLAEAAKLVAKQQNAAQPENVQFELNLDDSSEGPSTSNSSRTSSKEDLSQNDHLQNGDLTQNKDSIADGAVSDSEIDRHRNNDAVNEGTEWKWGELPEEKPKEENIPKPEEKPARWSRWWNWSRRSPKNELENQGVYLDDLLNDPIQREKYFGKSVGSTISNVDSGNGISLGASPSSPSALSVDSLNEVDDSTPTREDVVKALGKAEAVEHELLAGTDEHAKTPSTEIGAAFSEGGTNVCVSEKERKASGQSRTSDFGNPLSDDEIHVDIPHPCPVKKTKFLKSLRLDNDQLKSLGLQYGCNEARFSITTKFQGTAWCACHIYLWKWSEKIVISDIDGTITISDVLGHVIPAIGGQWAQPGVAELYTHIKNNGYRMIYLSSRAIGQSHYTKGYLRRIAQGSTTLPDGPVLLSPTSVLLAFRKEVIERKPEEFKIACLSDIKALFPVKQPFYAGFGNRETDVKSYTAVGIPPSRINIIDPSGKVRRADKIGFMSSYEEMANMTVDYLFPPLKMKRRASTPRSAEDTDTEGSRKLEKMKPEWTKPDKFSNYTHWRTSPTEFDTVDDELAEYEKQRKEMSEKNKKEEKAKKKKKFI
uniref:LNS2/PITP domain-containing protein n=1 Tax=Acrobeloides nanus TaxID=290746 RepID=A0A914DVS8_9BILA